MRRAMLIVFLLMHSLVLGHIPASGDPIVPFRPGALPATERGAGLREQLLRDWQNSTTAMAWDCTKLQQLTGSAFSRLGRQVREAGGRAPALQTFVMPAITNVKLNPNAYPGQATPSKEIAMRACPREYESATFILYALDDTERVSVRASDLKGPADAVIPASRVDIRVVKFWYQAGTTIRVGEKTLTPELLVKDDRLVTVDYIAQKNHLRDPNWIVDSPVLLPVDIPANTIKQFWVTIHVPANATAGMYEGTITIHPAGKRSVKMALKIEVLPFELEEPVLDYAIYYRSTLGVTNAVFGGIQSEERTEVQYVAELQNMLAHGVDNPTIYDGIDRLDQVLTLREQAGLPKKPLLFLGRCTGAPQADAELEALKRDVRRTIEIARKHGIQTVYFYGIDEATGDVLSAERKAFEAVHEAGGKVFVACYQGFFDLVGDLLDLPVMSGGTPWHIEEVHKLGHKMYNYGYPQCGVEEPETYRRNFGLRLWKLKFDGACDYAYQHPFGGTYWDDFDHPTYRDHNMTYPTVNGVVDTIQWEGWREGVDDVRYLSTLLKVMEQAKQDESKKELVAEAQSWLDNLDISGNLDDIRAGMIERIQKLR